MKKTIKTQKLLKILQSKTLLKSQNGDSWKDLCREIEKIFENENKVLEEVRDCNSKSCLIRKWKNQLK